MNKLKTIQGLYAITDPAHINDNDLLDAVTQAIDGGARIVQYRNKQASTEQQLTQALSLAQLCKQRQVCFIINDDPLLAKKVAADGVHIGKDDRQIADARNILGKDAIIGISCYNQLDNARKAQAEGADYIALGRFFPSQTKPDAVQANLQLLDIVRQEIALPIVAIGGITHNNAGQLIKHGADAIAVIYDLFHNKHNIKQAAQKFHLLFDNRSVPSPRGRGNKWMHTN